MDANRSTSASICVRALDAKRRVVQTSRRGAPGSDLELAGAGRALKLLGSRQGRALCSFRPRARPDSDRRSLRSARSCLHVWQFRRSRGKNRPMGGKNGRLWTVFPYLRCLAEADRSGCYAELQKVPCVIFLLGQKRGSPGVFFEGRSGVFCRRGMPGELEVISSPRHTALSALSPVSRRPPRPQALPSSGRWPKAIAFAQVGDRGSREVEAIEGGVPQICLAAG